VRRQALDAVGLLDERYRCYMDDVDICARLRGAGWRIWYEPTAEVVHLMGASTRRQTGGPSPAAIVNFNHYFGRQHGPAAATAARAIEMLGFGARAALYGLHAFGPDGAANRRRAADHARNARVTLRRGFV